MSDLNLSNPQVLGDMQAALARFSSRLTEALQVAENEVVRTNDWLNERMNHWQRELDRAQQELQRAQSDLRNCQSQRDSSCSSEEQAVRYAIQKCNYCEQALQTVRQWRDRINKEYSDYQRMAWRMQELAQQTTSAAAQSLKQYGNKYAEVYSSMSEGGGGDGGGGIGAAFNQAAQSAARSISDILSSIHPSRDLGDGMTESFANVDLDEVPMPDFDGPEDFQRTSMDDMMEGLRRWRDVVGPSVESGIGTNSEYWRDYDIAQGLVHPNGYQAVFEALYGDRPITVFRDAAGVIDIDHGHHRVWLGKRLGLSHLPMKVKRKLF
jgi:hypothetical protein